jgi:poly(A) polymerase/tRNA nucleotidyltransferase (CCA-adding enzyme)
MEFPKEILEVYKKLKENNFEAYLVGGCVRDFLIKKKPSDWDITTNAKPEEIQKIFKKSFYQNIFGTVSVITDSEDETLKVIEITPYRLEGKYTDKRHPDKVIFSDKLEDDLQRRDFTINGMAIDIKKNEIIDLFNGKQDLKNKIIRAIGAPEDRFKEDILRIIRAVRISTELDFEIEEKTFLAIQKISSNIYLISKERIRDEFVKILMNENAEKGIRLLEKTNILKYLIPELLEGLNVIGVTKHKKGHIKYEQLTTFEHNLKTLGYTAEKNFDLEVRLAALFHDIAKPRTKKGEGLSATFRSHEIIGAKMAKKILTRLRFSKKILDKVFLLVRWHFFFYNINEVSEAGVRRLIRNVKKENINNLLKLREADRKGSGLPKISPYRLKHLKYMIEKVSLDPIEPKMLLINGNELMELLNLSSSPRIGWILNSLLEEIIEKPEKNIKEYLIKKAKELNELSDIELKKLFEKAKKKKEEIEEEIDIKIKKKYLD